jgi:hypothetical protein
MYISYMCVYVNVNVNVYILQDKQIKFILYFLRFELISLVIQIINLNHI